MKTNKTAKTYAVPMTLHEMQMIANTLGNYFTFLANQKIPLPESVATTLYLVLHKMADVSRAVDKEPELIVDSHA